MQTALYFPVSLLRGVNYCTHAQWRRLAVKVIARSGHYTVFQKRDDTLIFKK